MQETMNDVTYSGPAWDNSTEYGGYSDPMLLADLARVAALIAQIDTCSLALAATVEHGRFSDSGPATAACDLLLLRDEALTLAGNVTTYASCALSVNGADGEAKKLLNRVEQERARLAVALQPLQMWVAMADETVMAVFFAHPVTHPHRFAISRLRKERDHLLTLAEEKLVKSLEIHGPAAFGHLYDGLSSLLRCTVELPHGPRTMGLAEAANHLRDPDPQVRRAVYDATNNAWQSQQESCAAVLNNINGWRHEIYRRRSQVKRVHFLDPALHRSCMERPTLDAMLDAVHRNRDIGRRALALKAKLMGVPALGPWDLFAPPPQMPEAGESLFSFASAVGLVSDAFDAIDPAMGAFVRLMQDKRWIEGSIQDNKRPGAYCTKFLKSRSPRVYMTYAGSLDNVATLAHELGHAFHSWLMRDLPLAELSYPMTLAETASIFAETALNDALMARCQGSPASLLPILWASAGDAEVFILNIPARFTFETRFNEIRQEQLLPPDEISRLMTEAWQTWYGESLSAMHPMFWASKLHFHMSSLSFYNFPYTFGYLFSLGVYAQRKVLGADFFPRYCELLRDTGRMTVEELAAKYLGCDLTGPAFWQSSLDIVAQKIAFFATVVDQIHPSAGLCYRLPDK